MDKIPDSIKPLIEKYISSLRKNGVRLDGAFLFGSYSRGMEDKWSDIDIALILKEFTGNRIKDRDKIRRYTLSVSSIIQVAPFAAEDFNEENPFAKEIIKTGIRINER